MTPEEVTYSVTMLASFVVYALFLGVLVVMAHSAWRRWRF